MYNLGLYSHEGGQSLGHFQIKVHVHACSTQNWTSMVRVMCPESGEVRSGGVVHTNRDRDDY